jgi:hypothetical protein
VTGGSEGEKERSRADTLEGWLAARVPPVPEAFLPFLLGSERGALRSPEDLEQRGLEGLRKALERPGRDRAAAFDLLVGDAYLTYACEAMARDVKPGEALEALLKRVGDHFL